MLRKPEGADPLNPSPIEREAMKTVIAEHPKADEFLIGVFSAMQYLVLNRDEPTLAKEIAKIHGMDAAWAFKESKRTGYCVPKMNKFIRENLK